MKILFLRTDSLQRNTAWKVLHPNKKSIWELIHSSIIFYISLRVGVRSWMLAKFEWIWSSCENTHTLTVFGCFLKKWTMKSAETFTSDFPCIFLCNFACNSKNAHSDNNLLQNLVYFLQPKEVKVNDLNFPMFPMYLGFKKQNKIYVLYFKKNYFPKKK